MENLPKEPSAEEFGYEPPLAPTVPPASPAPGPRLASALITSVIYYIAVFAVTVPLGVYMYLQKRPLDSLTLTFISQIIGWPVAMIAGVLISRRSWRDSFAIRPCPVRMIPGLILGCFGLSLVLNRLASQIPMPAFFESAFRDMMTGPPALNVLCLVILAPLAEELFFRGWMLRGFAAHYSKNKAIWFTAIIFGLFHLNPWQFVVAVPIGVIFASLTLKTGSLLPGLVGHFIVNLTGSQLLKPLAGLLGHGDQELEDATHLPWDMVGLGAVFAVAGFAWMQREMRRPTA
ncbi:MAG: type II CAAX endopeptidase family protein [Verrucomicrobiota bacterium]